MIRVCFKKYLRHKNKRIFNGRSTIISTEIERILLEGEKEAAYIQLILDEMEGRRIHVALVKFGRGSMSPDF